jgi:hypothetical protein
MSWSVPNSAVNIVESAKQKAEEQARQQEEARLAQEEVEVRRKAEEDAKLRLAQAEADVRQRAEEEARQRPSQVGTEVRRQAEEGATRHEERATLTEIEIKRVSANQELEPKSVRCQRALHLHAMGLQQIDGGNLSIARRFFKSAADAGLCKSAMALAGTYDESQLVNLKVLNLEPNAEAAQTWYAKARELCVEGRSVCDCPAARSICEEGDSDLARFRADYTSGSGLTYVIISDDKGEHIYRYGDESRLASKKDAQRYTLFLCNVPRLFTTLDADDKAALLKARVVKPGDPRFAELDAKYLATCDNRIDSAISKN